MSYWERHRQQYGAVVYQAGACVFFSLQRSIGRARMNELLRLLVSRHRFGVIDKADLLGAIAEVAPRLSLSRFMRRAHISP
jgi:aminopeptidase N